MTNEQIAKKLDVITKLLALSITEGKSESEKIDVMLSAGMETKDIANFVGKSENAIKIRKTRMKR